ncbi:right-handed parallel beta-helix repeat-containing protein [bacterium BMS3Abin03]|nr:right-handed parallel beta-helix repeat-containing protein [bacterium BMS3Abin03]
MSSSSKRLTHDFIASIFLLVIFCSIALIAQPSGGPYGPIQQTYDLPKVEGKIYYVASDGKADQSGEELSNPTTIEAAIEKVKTGDAIVMRGGTYRTGNLVFNQGITIQPYKDELPVLKGTYIAKDWEKQENGLWVTKWEYLFPSKPDSWWRRYRHGSDVPLHRFNNDMVFVNGRFLQSAGWEGELDENSYYIDYETGLVYLAVDPTDKLIEITAFNVGLLRTTKDVHGKTSDKIGPTIRGITLTQYAYRAIEVEGYYPEKLDPEENHGKDVIGSTFENCTISYCSRVAGYFKGDHMTFRHCKISNTSTEGIYIIASSDVLLEKNIFERNNIEHLQGYYPSAVKIFNQCYRVTCRDNLVRDLENSIGIWYDVGNVDGVFINNWCENVHYNETHRKPNDVWPTGAGFYFEISKGAVCAGNLFVNCDAGIHLRNAANVEVYQNTFINSQALIGRDTRTAKGDHFDWHPSTGPGIDERDGHTFENNLIVENEDFNEPLLYIWQPEALCGMVTKPQLKQLDYNVYVRTFEDNASALIQWCTFENNDCKTLFLNSVDELQKINPEYSVHSKYFPNYHGPLFKGIEVGNYQLLKSFPGSNDAAVLPSEISKLLGQTGKYFGAYPPVQ